MCGSRLSEVVGKVLSSKTLVFDYDGVLAPIGVRREESRIYPEVEGKLRELTRRYVVVIASTKDCSFLKSRVGFAHILVCSNGFEVKIGVLSTIPKMPSAKKLEFFYKMISEARELAKSHGMEVEVKKVVVEPLDIPVGLCIDWRRSSLSTKEALDVIAPIVKEAAEEGLSIVRYPNQPYIDIFIEDVNKGQAIKSLLSVGAISRPITYFGDSENDLPAFKVADVGVLIRHEENEELNVSGVYELTREEFFELVNILSRV